MADPKMSVSEAMDVAVRLTNHYRAFEKIREMLEAVASLEGEKNVILQAIREAEARKAPALREADAAEAKLIKKQMELDAFVRSFDQRKASAAAKFQADLTALEAKYLEEKDRLSSQIAKQSSENKEQIEALEARRSDLQREVCDTESRLTELQQRVASTVKAWQEGKGALDSVRIFRLIRIRKD